MNEALFQLISYFFIYSFLGWCMEIAYAALKKKHFYNRGVLNGPLCPVYGIGMILILTFFSSLRESLVFLAIGSAVIATILEFFTGALMEKLFKKRWWDYSDYKYNLGGYVCIPFSALGRGSGAYSPFYSSIDPYGHQPGSSTGRTDYPHRRSRHPGHGFYQRTRCGLPGTEIQHPRGRAGRGNAADFQQTGARHLYPDRNTNG